MFHYAKEPGEEQHLGTNDFKFREFTAVSMQGFTAWCNAPAQARIMPTAILHHYRYCKELLRYREESFYSNSGEALEQVAQRDVSRTHPWRHRRSGWMGL